MCYLLAILICIYKKNFFLLFHFFRKGQIKRDTITFSKEDIYKVEYKTSELLAGNFIVVFK